jgi:hypothetical protein
MKLTKCEGTDCPLRLECKRFTKDIEYPQEFFAQVPYYDGNCQMFLGEKSDSVWNQLTTILNPSKNDNSRN